MPKMATPPSSGWVKATCNYSAGETKAVVQSARLLHAIPRGPVGGACRHDRVVPQLRLLARVFANPRCADQFPDSAALLVGHAGGLWFNEFDVVVQRWQTLADADGAHGAHERAHCHRDAHVSIVGERVLSRAHGGVVAGSVIEEIFARFCDTEFRADWDTGATRWGTRCTPA